jgi:ADP-heptose:LPS heptosyltransferase
MTVPVLLALSRQNPEVRLVFVTRPHFAPILRRVPNLQVHPFEAKGRHKGFGGLLRLYKDLQKIPFDAIADLHSVLRTRILRVFFSASGVPFARLDKGRKQKRRLTSWTHKDFRPLKSTHERYADVFRSLGFSLELTPGDLLKPEPWPEAFDRPGTYSRTTCIGIAPFAAHKGKCYPEARIKELIELLGGLSDLRIYLFGGGPGETEILRGWEREYGHCICVAGKAVLSDELALISNLRLMVSMDSGNGHLAAMYGLPVITLWGVTHPFAGFAPFGQPGENFMLSDRDQYPAIPTSVYGNKQPRGYDRAMDTIPPERVYKRILEILQAPDPRRQPSGRGA